jgi:hypothetical protein
VASSSAAAAAPKGYLPTSGRRGGRGTVAGSLDSG